MFPIMLGSIVGLLVSQGCDVRAVLLEQFGLSCDRFGFGFGLVSHGFDVNALLLLLLEQHGPHPFCPADQTA